MALARLRSLRGFNSRNRLRRLKEPPEETSSADILGANIAQLEVLSSTDGLGITPGSPTVWAQGVVAGFDVR